MPKLNLIGDRYGRWRIVSRADNRNGQSAWRCECDCGSIVDVAQSSLRGGASRSCGCLKDEEMLARNLTHGYARTPIYQIWSGMITRCTNPNEENWRHYGGRGITVCDRWRKFENFLEDMGLPPEGLTLERMHNDGDYEPSNCRWATKREQGWNRRTSRTITWRGATKCAMAWAEQFGVDYQFFYDAMLRNPSRRRNLASSAK